ncbi:uncharacterized protein LOC129592566 [Paramacrobiotus metropolitanus]|uniref:uncharacterized protein LOC129592566 n=1 Tax=Paramacrobiotus metropolitanus TaxID=2943436 RepID=UPI0024464595|nr:uncharacterized protein LOC129592566 [Paramacrobiotus metropolitanus]
MDPAEEKRRAICIVITIAFFGSLLALVLILSGITLGTVTTFLPYQPSAAASIDEANTTLDFTFNNDTMPTFKFMIKGLWHILDFICPFLPANSTTICDGKGLGLNVTMSAIGGGLILERPPAQMP